MELEDTSRIDGKPQVAFLCHLRGFCRVANSGRSPLEELFFWDIRRRIVDLGFLLILLSSNQPRKRITHSVVSSWLGVIYLVAANVVEDTCLETVRIERIWNGSAICQFEFW